MKTLNKTISIARSPLYSLRNATAALLVALTLLIGQQVQAASNSDLNQSINNGTLSTDIRDASRNSVASPSIAMSAATFSYACLSGGNAPTGTLGSDSQRLYVDNPGAANNGWTLTIGATAGPTALWQNGGNSANYDFNDTASSGCADGADTDTRAGQLTINASPATLTTDCASCSTNSITKGSSTAFAEGVTDSVTLLNAAAASDDYGRWYLTGVGLSQTIPAEQTVDNYTLNLTLTVAAS